MTDRFELLERIGRGGMGVVWRARDTETGEIVAVKLLHEMYADDPDYVARFEREVEVASRIVSPHVVRIFGFGRQDGRPFMAMEYVPGRNLRELIREAGPQPWERARTIAWQVADGIAAAHAAGVVHRDIKPSNILLGVDGVARLADFGVARALDLSRLTGSQTFLGSPEYMAPDPEPGPASDLYGLGCVLYELLTGEPPFSGESIHQVLYRHMRERVDVSRLPAEAQPIVGALLSKDPEQRPTNLHRTLRPPEPPLVRSAPKAASARLDVHLAGQFRTGRASAVTALAAMTSEPLLIGGTRDGGLYAWREQALAPVRESRPNGDDVRALSADPRGRYVLVADASAIRRWDVATGVVETLLAGAFSQVVSLNGGRFATLDEEGSLRAFAVFGGPALIPVTKYLHDATGITRLALSPGGEWLAIAGPRGQVTVVTTDSWWPAFRSPEAAARIDCLAFASRETISWVGSGGAFFYWDFHRAGPDRASALRGRQVAHQAFAGATGSLVSLVRDGTLSVMARDGLAWRSAPGAFSTAHVAALSDAGPGRFAVGHEDGSVALFTVSRPAETAGPPP